MLTVLLSGLIAFQDPPPKPPDQQPAVEAPKVVESWDDRRAKDAVKELNKVFKKKSSSMKDRNDALEAIASASNKNFVKPLARIVEHDKSVVIRRRAAQLLANQPAKNTTRTVLKLVNNGRIESTPSVQADVIRALSKCGYTSKNWKEIDNLFEREYHLDRVPIQEALLELIAEHKEKEAIPILLRNLDEPRPAWVDDPNNPPASYWEARWKSWRVWRPKVKEALFQITGQRFNNADEARVWLKKNKLK